MRRQSIALATLAVTTALLASCSKDNPVAPTPRLPRTLTVDPYGTAGYRTIQSALDASVDGDTISLVNGRHDGDGNRDLDFGDRSIVLRSERGNALNCIIDADGYYLQAPVHHSHMQFHRKRAFAHLNDEPPVVIVENLRIEDGFQSVLCDSGTAPVFRNCTFERSYHAITARSARPVFINCSFDDNDGGLFCERGATVTVQGGRVWQNFSFDSGAGITVRSSSLRVSDCQFIRNSTTDQGPAIYAERDNQGGRPRVEVLNCQFHYNGPNEAIWMDHADFLVQGSVFSDQEVAAFIYGQSLGQFIGSVFYGNGIYLGSESAASIESCIIAFVGAGPGLNCAWDDSVTVSLRCTDLFGNTDDCGMDQVGTNGNVSVDPLFCYFNEGDFALYPESPLVQNTDCLPEGGWPVGCGPVTLRR